MSERYLVTGAQLGMLIALPTEKRRTEIVQEIIDKQFLDNSIIKINIMKTNEKK